MRHYILAIILLVPASVSAHDQWLEVDPFHAPSATRTKLYLMIGEHFADAQPVQPRHRDKYTRFDLHSVRARVDLLPRLAEDQSPITIVNNREAPSGSYLVVLDSMPREIELEPSKFQQYLLEERLIDILATRADARTEDVRGRERYSRCLKAIFQVGPTFDTSVTKALGQVLEIVPATNPYALKIGDDLAVRVLFKDKPLAHRAVMVANRYRSRITTKILRTESDGTITFRLERGGDWMVRLVHMQAATERGVDWRSWWSSMTFSVGEEVYRMRGDAGEP